MSQLRDPGERVVVTLPAWVNALRDSGIQAMVVLALIAIAGFVLMGLAWSGAARLIYVPLQVPWLVSGGAVGLALVGTAFAAWNIQLGRRHDAVHRAEVEQIVRDVTERLEQLRAEGGLRRR
jgi:hypothetical protein